MLQSSIEMEIECHELTNQPPPKEIEACRMITNISTVNSYINNALVLMQRDKERASVRRVLSSALMNT